MNQRGGIMLRQASTAILASLLSLFANAGTAVSGGGGAVYCGTNHPAELFDFYEARVLRNIEIDLGAGDHMQLVRNALQRIAKHDPERAYEYSDLADTFMQEAKFLPNVMLSEVPDVGNVALPVGCELRQVVIQAEPNFPGDPYYIVSKDLWDLMNESSKAGLILHEIIYREAIERGQKSSVNVRYFNSMIANKNFNQLSLANYAELINLIQFYVGFVWQHPQTQMWWSLESESSSDCREQGGRRPTQSDLDSSYPLLGKALKDLQIITSWRPSFIVPGQYPSFFELFEDRFEPISKNVHYSMDFCLTSTNPFPL